MKSIKLFYVIQTCFVYLLFGQLAKAQTTTSCFEIQSILVDACAPPPINGYSQEYRNEMLRFLVGPNPLNINNMYMDFGYGQTFQGIRTPDAITAAKTAELNATIQSCGQLIEPVNGVLPANAKVLWISSYLVSASSNSFSNLGETLYVIYHNSNTELNIAYFINYAPVNTPPAPDNIVVNVSFGGASCSDVVNYFRSILVRQNGTIGAEDGATVNFTFAGNPTYTNGGCFAPYTPLSAAWTNPNTICSSSPPLNLLATVTGTPGGTFTGPGVTNNVFNPSGQSGLVQITYTVVSGTCQRLLTQFIQVNVSQSAAWTAPVAPLCQGATLALAPLITGGTGGTWSGSGVTGSTFNSAGLSGNIPITYTIGTGACQAVSTQNVQVVASGNATWTPPVSLCSNSTPVNLNTTVTGTAGGTWSGAGVDAAGLFNPTGLTGNSSSITYTVGSGTCQAVSTQTIQVIPSGSPAWTLPSPACTGAPSINLATTITGTTGGTWSGTGVTANGTFTPGAVAGSFPITYTVGSGACASVLTQNIQVISSGIATWTVPTGLCETSAPVNLNTTITGTTGGAWSGTGVDAAGLFNPAGLTGNSSSITYTVGSGACQAVSTQTIQVIPSGSPAWTLPSPPCAGSPSINLASTITGTTGGTWSGTGVTANGTFTPGNAAGSFPITYTVGSGACTSVLTQNIQVIASGLATWTNPAGVCETSAPINLATLITGTPGGTWSGSGVNAAGLFNPSGLTGAISITYSVGSGSCLATQVNIINVSPPPVAPSIDGTLIYCSNALLQPLSATGVAGATFNWYSNATLSTLLTTGSTFTPALTNSSIWVTQTVTGCTSPPAQVSLTFNPAPAIPQVQNAVSYCSGATPQALTASGTSGVFNWYTSAALTNPVSTGATYQPTGPGSFQLWVTEELNGCKSNPAIVTITEQPLVQATISPNGPLAICAGEQVSLSSSSPSNNLWSTGETTQSIQVNSAGTITLTVTGSCNQATDEVTVSQDLITASFTPSVLSGQAPLEVSFTSQTDNAASCDWLLDGGSVGDLTGAPVVFDKAGVFRITLICKSPAGCESRDVKTIVVEGEDVRLYIPNAFSPNGDSINGVFKAKGVGIVELKGSIYDRWGQLVFSWTGLNNGWDGTIKGNKAPNGIYAFRLDGIDTNKKKILEFGSVMLIH